MPAAGVTRPTVVAGRTVLEPGSPVVWFTFPGARHDIGRFHTVDGTFTGYYANILTPVDLDADPPGSGSDRTAEDVAAPDDGGVGDIWLTTDLFLDVFLDLDGEAHVLDRGELQEAVTVGWVDGTAAREAELEANRLVEAARVGAWPPPIVDAWPLDRVRDIAER
ncbi:MAG: DUF402 domain-containing protein [Longimicrobiales bacterium]|nr:DUF402 domain-containing protein [Longimicrobiales bacterium]